MKSFRIFNNEKFCIETENYGTTLSVKKIENAVLNKILFINDTIPVISNIFKHLSSCTDKDFKHFLETSTI